MSRKLLPLLLLLAAAFSTPVVAASDEGPTGAGKAIYLPLESFVINLQSPGRRMHFMQVSVQVMTHESRVAAAIEDNMPPVRDAIIMLLTEQSQESMGQVAGREAIRVEAQNAIQQVLNNVAGLETGVEAVYFTDFVVQ